MKHTIKEIVAYYKKIFKTNDPFEQADFLHILYQIGNISIEGCYMYLKNHRYIFINQNLSEHEMKLVMAHKLGHAVLQILNPIRALITTEPAVSGAYTIQIRIS